MKSVLTQSTTGIHAKKFYSVTLSLITNKVDTYTYKWDNSFMSIMYIARWRICTVTGRAGSKTTYASTFGKGGNYSIGSGYMNRSDAIASSSGDSFVMEYYSPHRTRGLL